MGQKVNPKGMRIGVIKGWDSQWFANKKNFGANILEDNNIRKFITKNYKSYGISKVIIERGADKLTVSIHTSRPGMVIGQKGVGVEAMKAEIAKISSAKVVNINVVEIKSPDTDSKLVAESIAAQLEARVGFRRAMKQALSRSTKAGVKGIKITVGGRLDGAEIARSEHYHEGRLPLHTIRADIDYATHEAHTTFGVVGVKVWICKGEILNKKAVTMDNTSNNGGADLC